jgi:putative effector of murein hydrolase
MAVSSELGGISSVTVLAVLIYRGPSEISSAPFLIRLFENQQPTAWRGDWIGRCFHLAGINPSSSLRIPTRNRQRAIEIGEIEGAQSGLNPSGVKWPFYDVFYSLLFMP